VWINSDRYANAWRTGSARCAVCIFAISSLNLDRQANAKPMFTMDPPGVMLHEWRGAVVSHHIAIGRFDGPPAFQVYQYICAHRRDIALGAVIRMSQKDHGTDSIV
jgi:hypothetical protein